MSKYTKLYVDRIINEVQTLEDIGGPATLEEYIDVLSTVKANIDQRIQTAFIRLITEQRQQSES